MCAGLPLGRALQRRLKKLNGLYRAPPRPAIVCSAGLGLACADLRSALLPIIWSNRVNPDNSSGADVTALSRTCQELFPPCFQRITGLQVETWQTQTAPVFSSGRPIGEATISFPGIAKGWTCCEQQFAEACAGNCWTWGWIDSDGHVPRLSVRHVFNSEA
jgi:hypothetical protein